ncbi:hypothetical protein BCR44DRAFT_1440308 [Catenaria anguillulae PL171]|uniref:Thiaminase-2/PQQC domain-containing protein n=1 Tax=Catenaria anguillulae PL171 TaxID=765915 RepID=A0A1Y2HD06_9FUNG|nr:hypothetical protein BCR44DRAFT_1440308 [Catenaria anguillulae PL171]
MTVNTSTDALTFTAQATSHFAANWAKIATPSFLAHLRANTLPRAAFNRWLLQDYLFVIEFAKLLGTIFTLAPRRDNDLLLTGFLALKDEIAWFEAHLTKLGVSLPHPDEFVRVSEQAPGNGIQVRPACAEFVTWLGDLQTQVLGEGKDRRAAYRQLLVAYWAGEKAYNLAWGSLRGDAKVPDEYKEFVDRWTNPLFDQFVVDMGVAVDREFAREEVTEDDKKAAMAVVEKVTVLEDKFWAMVYGADE